jgi:hypothetical protein
MVGRRPGNRLFHGLIAIAAVASLLAPLFSPSTAEAADVMTEAWAAQYGDPRAEAALAQYAEPIIEWGKTFGGASDEGVFTNLEKTSDGGYVIVGSTDSYGAGANDIWLVKIDASGNPAWNKTFGGSANDYGLDARETSDGGYIVMGQTYSYGAGGADIWLVKTDSSGSQIWGKTYGGKWTEGAPSVRQTSDGGYAIMGYTTSYGAGLKDCWLIKTDSNGNKVWDKTFGGVGNDVTRCGQVTSDGGFVMVGYTESYGAGGNDIWLIKVNSSGSKVWDKTFGGSGDDWGGSVHETSDGGFIVLGYTTSYGNGSSDYWLVKTDASGSKVWDKTFGGPDADEGYCVQQTSDGGYVMTGQTQSYGSGSWDLWVIKADGNGNQMWQKLAGGTASDCGYSVQETSDGGFAALGITASYGAGGDDLWLMKLGSSMTNPPDTPGNVAPADGAAGISLTPTLQSSGFSDPDTGDTHAASEWQLRIGTGDYSSLAFDSGRDTTNLTAIAVPSGRLSDSTTYYWRVRHQDNHGAWSSWSAETSFSVEATEPSPSTSKNAFPWWVLVVMGLAALSLGAVGFTYYRSKKKPPPPPSVDDFGDIKSLIHETDDVLRKAVDSAVLAHDALWVNALRFLRDELSDLGRKVEVGTIGYADAKDRALNLRRRADSLRDPPHTQPPSGGTRSAPSIDDLAYLNLGVSRSADSYEILGVNHTATKEEVRSAYRQKMDEWHPDRWRTKRGTEISNAVSKIINNAKDQIYKQRGWK